MRLGGKVMGGGGVVIETIIEDKSVAGGGQNILHVIRKNLKRGWSINRESVKVTEYVSYG